MSGKVDKIIFDSSGHTGNTYYARFVNDETGAIFDDRTAVAGGQIMIAAATAVWANCAIALTEQLLTGQFPIVIPTELPTGIRYKVVVYLQAGSNPVNTDDVEQEYEFMNGGIFGF